MLPTLCRFAMLYTIKKQGGWLACWLPFVVAAAASGVSTVDDAAFAASAIARHKPASAYTSVCLACH